MYKRQEQNLNALKSGDDSLANVLSLQQERLMSSRYLAAINFAKNNGDLALAPYLMTTDAFDANLKYHDTVYSSLTPEIQNSKYGKELKAIIKTRSN